MNVVVSGVVVAPAVKLTAEHGSKLVPVTSTVILLPAD